MEKFVKLYLLILDAGKMYSIFYFRLGNWSLKQLKNFIVNFIVTYLLNIISWAHKLKSVGDELWTYRLLGVVNDAKIWSTP